MADGEFIVVCIDNSAEAGHRGTHAAQIVALKHYCKTHLADNPKTLVTLFSMGSNDYHHMPRPATDYKQIKLYLPSIRSTGAGCVRFEDALIDAGAWCVSRSPNKQKRILFLVGSPVDLNGEEMKFYGSKFKHLGIALDVVSFSLGEKLKHTFIKNQYGRMELDALFGAANSGNSTIKHVELKDIKPGSSSIRRVISMFILKTNHHKKAKGKTHAAGDNKHVPSDALSLENEGVKLGKRKAV